jgi:hypothetical protein
MRFPATVVGLPRLGGRAVELDLGILGPREFPTMYAYLIWSMTIAPEIARALPLGQRVEVVLVREHPGDWYVSLPADPAWLTWNNGTVRQLAQHICTKGEFTLLPILADALDEAGCTETALLGRCRQPNDDDLGWLVELLAAQE